METLEVIVAVSLGALAAVFLGTMAVLIFLCYRKVSNKNSKMFNVDEFRCNSHLVSGNEFEGESQMSEFELDDVKLASQIRTILNNTQWVDDANGLIPHSLGILKLCHQLIERLTVSALASHHRDLLHEVIKLSRRISPRIDDVASAMYPPLDPRLLEARCCALVCYIHLLVWHSKPTTPKSMQNYMKAALLDMDKHVRVLRNAALNYETVLRVFRDENSTPAGQC